MNEFVNNVWNWVAIFLALIVLYLILNPETCQKVKNYFRNAGSKLVKSARNRLSDIDRLWNRTDVITALKENRSDIVDQMTESEEARLIARERRRRKRAAEPRGFLFDRLRRQSGAPQQQSGAAPQQQNNVAPQQQNAAAPPIDYEKIDKEAAATAHDTFERLVSSHPDSGTTMQAWVRRFLYSGMLIVMITTDVGITVFRLEALRFFTIPSELTPWLNRVFLLTPLVLISSVLLAKMALDETSNTLSPYVKLVPFDRGASANIKKALPYVVLVLGLSNSLLLVYAASSIGSGLGTTFHAYEFFLFIGLLLLTLLASYMGGTALFQTINLIFGVPFNLIIAAIASVLGLCALMVSGFLGLLETIGNWLRRAFRLIPSSSVSRQPLPPPPPADGTILLGLGTRGAQMTVLIGSVLRNLNKPFPTPALLYADVYSPDASYHTKARVELLGLATYSPQITVDTANPEGELSATLPNVHSLESTGAATIICLARDDDITMSVRALKQYEQFIKESHKLQRNTTRNPIRFVLVWMLPRHSAIANAANQGVLAQTAQEIETWANDKSSLLAGTILINDDSSLMTDAPGKDTLIARAFASFIMSSRYGNALSLEEMALQMKGAECAFAALATGTIGVNSVVLDFDGQRHGVTDDGFLSLRLNTLVGKYFQNQLTSFNEAPSSTSAAKFATVISPHGGTLLDKIRDWLSTQQFDISANNIALIPVDLSPKIDLSVSGKFADHGGQAHPQLSLIYTLDRRVALP